MQTNHEHSDRAHLIVGSLFKCGKCNSWHLDTGTGFLLAESAIATCFHIVHNPTHKAVVVMTSDGRIHPVEEVLAADHKTNCRQRSNLPFCAPRIEPHHCSCAYDRAGELRIMEHQ